MTTFNKSIATQEKPMQSQHDRVVQQRRRRRIAQEAMTLIEIMIVIVIMAMIATAAGFAILPSLQKARVKQAGSDAKTVRSAVEMYLAENQDCPTVEQLVSSKILDKGKAVKDPWGHDYSIECTEDGPVVRSAGPDGQTGTDDDIE
jgi:general secretion pathway protein G